MQIILDGEWLALLASLRKGSGGLEGLLLGKALSGLVVETRPDGTVVLEVGEQKLPLRFSRGEFTAGEEVFFRLVRDKAGALLLELLPRVGTAPANPAPAADSVEVLALSRLAARFADLESALLSLPEKPLGPTLPAFLEPVRNFFNAPASFSPPAALPPALKAAFLAGEALAREPRLPAERRERIAQWIADARRIFPPEIPAAPAVVWKIIPGREGFVPPAAEAVWARIDEVPPAGPIKLRFENGATLQVSAPEPPPPASAVRVAFQGESALLILEVRPAALSPPFPAPLPSLRPVQLQIAESPQLPPALRDEFIRRSVELKLLKHPDAPVPETLSALLHHVSALAAGPGLLETEPESLIRQALYLHAKGVEPSKIVPAMTFFRDAASFGPRLFELIERLFEALEPSLSFRQIVLSRTTEAGGAIPDFTLPSKPSSPLSAVAEWVPAAAEVLRRLISALVPVRPDTMEATSPRKEEVRDSHREGGLFLEGKLYRGMFSRLLNEHRVLPDLKAALLRLVPLLERLDLPAEARSRLVQETSRLIQVIEAFQVKNLAEPEFIHWLLPLVDRQGPATAMVAFHRRGRRRKIDKNNASLNLRLSLSALGPVEARVEVRHGFLWVVFLLERPECEPLFRDSIPDLSRRLKKTGYRIGKLTVGVPPRRKASAGRPAASGLDLRA